MRPAPASPPARSELQRVLAPITDASVDDGPGSGEPEWLHLGDWRLLARPRVGYGVGEPVATFTTASGRTISARLDPRSGSVFVPFSLSEAYLNYVLERWRASDRPRALSARQLDLFYGAKRFIPRSVQLRARRMLIRLQKDPEFPRWPLDQSVSRLVRFYAKCLMLSEGTRELRFRWFWPETHRAALVLTHDVESADGLRRAVDLADLEEARGLRSSFNVVADEYPIDWGILRELRERGFELGLHGVHHDRSMFASRAAFEAQQPRLRELAAKLGAVGFRSPATHRVIDWLAELPVSYDCSVPHSDPFEPQPGGCCSLWPYFIGDVVELPYTLPQDHTVFTLLGVRSIERWRTQLERVEQLNGLVQLVTHPDPGYLADPPKRALYVELLDLVRDRPGLWRALPRDVATWWRRRDAAHGSEPDLLLGTARLDGDVVLDPPPVGKN
jgi:peptidoglycan/xylan/chitin deacetylase (PgdA/CDA1 family)